MNTSIYEYLKGIVRSRLDKRVWARYVWLMGQYKYMNGLGYFRSAHESVPVDVDGRPLPWFTYPMIAFLGHRLTDNLSVFEFGSGNSTLWFAERVRQVVSVEHSRDWYEKMQPSLPANVTYLFRELDENGQYCRTATELGDHFDVVVIDGRDRVNCALNSLSVLKDGGVMIWDDSDRSKYAGGIAQLKQMGFRMLEFCGPAPCNSMGYCTSIFYRANNCLGI